MNVGSQGVVIDLIGAVYFDRCRIWLTERFFVFCGSRWLEFIGNRIGEREDVAIIIGIVYFSCE